MATGFNSTTGAAFLQRFYSPGFIANSIAAKSSRLLALIKKNPEAAGDSYNFLSVVDELPTGSADFATAQGMAANNTATIGSQFSIPYSESNEPVRVSGKQIAQTRNNNAAWTSALKFAMDSGLRVAAHRLSVALYTQGWGELSQIASVSGATFKPKILAHVSRYLVGMKLVFSSALNTAGLRSATTLTVTGINYSTGVITCSANLSTVSAVNDDFAFTAGDRQDSATPTRLRPAGLPAWIPLQPVTDTTLSTLYGVVRSNNTRLYGNYVDGTAQTLADALITAAQTCSGIGNASKLVAVMSLNNAAALSRALGSDKRYVDVDNKAGIGFKTFIVYADGVEVPVLADKYLGDDVAFMVDPSTVELASLGPAPHIQTDDGQKMMRIGDDNGVEVRIVSYTAMAVHNPAACAIIQLQ